VLEASILGHSMATESGQARPAGRDTSPMSRDRKIVRADREKMRQAAAVRSEMSRRNSQRAGQGAMVGMLIVRRNRTDGRPHLRAMRWRRMDLRRPVESAWLAQPPAARDGRAGLAPPHRSISRSTQLRSVAPVWKRHERAAERLKISARISIYAVGPAGRIDR
jgi:hypothetical protein